MRKKLYIPNGQWRFPQAPHRVPAPDRDERGCFPEPGNERGCFPEARGDRGCFPAARPWLPRRPRSRRA